MFLRNHFCWSFLAGAFLLAAYTAEAHCGLEFCPITHTGDKRGALGLETDASWKHTAFDIGGEGSYEEGQLHLLYRKPEGWTFAAHLSAVSLDAPGADGRKLGLANPLFSAERRFAFGDGLGLAVGLQVEMPFGDQEDGMAADHWMGVPFATLSDQVGMIFYGAQIGLSTLLPPWGGDAKPSGNAGDTVTGGDPTLYVGPHEDHEMLYRFSVGGMDVLPDISPEAWISGRYVLEKNAENVHFITAGVDVACKMGEGWLIKPNAEIPLTHPHRMDWSAGLDVGRAF